MKVTILGATGQIGSIIFNNLSHHHKVFGTTRRPATPFFRFDPFHDDWSLLGESDVIINCIGMIDATRLRTFDHIHVGITKTIIKNRERIGNPRIIQISALGASASHHVEFLRTKGIADDLLLEQENTIVVRPSIVCTPGTMIVKKLLMLLRIARYTAGRVFVPDGFLATRIQPVMPDDFLSAIAVLCTKAAAPKVLEIGGPLRLSFQELVAMMFAMKGRKPEVLPVPRRFSDPLFKYVISRLFPGVISAQQYELLFQDNVVDTRVFENIIGRETLSPEPFFIKEFKDA